MKISPRDLALHSLIFSVYPVLFLYGRNFSQVSPKQTIIPLLLSLSLMLAFMALFKLIFRDRLKSCLMASWSFMLFSSGGRLLDYQLRFLLPVNPQVISLFVLTALWTAFFLILRDIQGALNPLNTLFNIVSAVLAVAAASTIVLAAVSMPAAPQSNGPTPSVAPAAGGRLPDVYLIVLDTYPRGDVLEGYFGFDNSEFLDGLRARGFYVANRSRSNYAETLLSLASAMNMEYLDGSGFAADANAELRAPSTFYPSFWMIRDSRVQGFLASRGYTVVNFRSGWGVTDDLISADRQYGPPKGPWGDGFISALAQTTALKFLYSSGLLSLDWKDNVLYSLDNLGNVSKEGGPKFVIAHILAPHQPFLFDRDGNPPNDPGQSMMHSSDPRAREEFIDQLVYINRRTLAAVDGILNGSNSPPVIIVMGDHGIYPVDGDFTVCTDGALANGFNESQREQRMGNLNAYLIPGGGGGRLYDSITPVNSFRVVFDGVFGENYTLLPDRSFFSCTDYPFRLTEMEPQRR